MPVLIQIAFGGALGAVLRHAAGSLGARVFGTGFPLGTFIVNVTGCFVMGGIFVLAMEKGALSPERHAPLLMTGVLGGFTTFSAWSLETFHLLEAGRTLAAAAYALGSMTLCLLAVACGVTLARSL